MFGFLVFRQQFKFVYSVATRISKEKLLQFLNGNYSDFVHTDSSKNIKQISHEPIEFCQYVLYGVQQVFSQAAIIVITITAILFYNPMLFPLLLLLLAPPILIIAFFTKKKLQQMRMHVKQTSEKTIQHLQESLAGFVESNIYLKNNFFTGRYHVFQKQLNDYLSENQVIQNMPSRFIEVFAVFGLLVMVSLNEWLLNGNPLSVVTIGAFVAAAYKVIPGIVKMMNAFGQAKTYAFTITDLLPQHKLVTKGNTGKGLRCVRFKDVSYAYKEKLVVKSLSFEIKRGDIIGISGLSGKGKTTIINLLLGFLTPDAGSIFMNDEPATNEERQTYWSKISYVKQQAFFIHDTLLQNIVLTKDDYDHEKLTEVLEVTGVADFANTSTLRLQKIITENAKNYSGGQRQRIAFARALYHDFDLLILDEPFNELDEVSENKMLHYLQKKASTGKMILLITHNKTALTFCSKTLVLDEHSG